MRIHQLFLELLFVMLILSLWPTFMASLAALFAHDPNEPVEKIKKIRLLKPKTDRDCPLCQAQAAEGDEPHTKCEKHVIPWEMRKGKGGRKKTVGTDGYFCSNPKCYYYLMDDERVHALVGYGYHGKKERIRDLRCQHCRKKFTVRRHTMLYRLRTVSSVVVVMVNLMVTGTDPASLFEAVGIRENTLRTWLARGGAQGQKLHQRFFANLELSQVQLDELWASVKRAKEDIWLWIALDAQTKVIPVIELGPRTQEMAYTVLHKLKECLKPGWLPAFTTDGLKHYFYALTAHFGEWEIPEEGGKPVWAVAKEFLYAQVVKRHKRQRLVKVDHRMMWGELEAFAEKLKALGLSGNINTSFVERVNLTLRQCISMLTRRSWGPAQYTPELLDHVYLWLAYYHFVRCHESLRIKLEQPVLRKGKQRPIEYRRRTPAMAARIVSRRWSMLQMMSYPLP